KVALACNAPIPLHVFNPVLVARTHVLGMPAYPTPCLQQSLFLIQNANEPLSRVQVLYGRTAAFVRPDFVFYRFLAWNPTRPFQVTKHTLARLQNRQASICAS